MISFYGEPFFLCFATKLTLKSRHEKSILYLDKLETEKKSLLFEKRPFFFLFKFFYSHFLFGMFHEMQIFKFKAGRLVKATEIGTK